MKIWSEKHFPKVNEIPQPVEELKNSILKKQHIFIYGPTGTGKTSAVYSIARELNYEIIETNASDYRNKESIKECITNSSKNLSLFSKSKIILVDEIDLTTQRDYGCIPEILKVLPGSKYPIIFTANKIDKKLKPLTKECRIMEFKKPDYRKIADILKTICTKENIMYDDAKLKIIARKSDGDIRASINDLQSCIINKEVDTTSLESRNINREIKEALKIIFKTRNIKISINSLEETDFSLEDFSLWLDENLPLEYTDVEDLEKAYKKFSKADIFKARIIKQQYWRFLVYQSILLSAGISLSKKEKYSKQINYKPTSRLLKIWKYNMINQRKKYIAEKLSKYLHCSKKEAFSIINFLKKFPEKNALAQDLQLDEKEVIFLKK